MHRDVWAEPGGGSGIIRSGVSPSPSGLEAVPLIADLISAKDQAPKTILAPGAARTPILDRSGSGCAGCLDRPLGEVMTRPGIGMADGGAGPSLDEGVAGGPRTTDCRNCAAPLRGRFCHDCGQSADLGKRRVFRLIAETAASLVNFDNRLVRTLSLLFLRPGVLARDMIDGRIARYTPPFQTFLVSASLFILASTYAFQQAPETPKAQIPAAEASGVPPDPTAVSGEFSEGELKLVRQALISNWGLSSSQADIFIHGLNKAATGEVEFYIRVFNDFGKLLIYILPIFTVILSLLYFGRKEFFLQDHFLISCYISASILFPSSLSMILPYPWDMITAGLVAVWNAVGMHHVLRVGYGSSTLGALLKTSVLWIGTYSILLALLLGVLVLTLFQF